MRICTNLDKNSTILIFNKFLSSLKTNKKSYFKKVTKFETDIKNNQEGSNPSNEDKYGWTCT